MSTTKMSLDDHFFEGKQKNEGPSRSIATPVTSVPKKMTTQNISKRWHIGKVTAVILSVAVVLIGVKLLLPFIPHNSVLGVNTGTGAGIFSQPTLKTDDDAKTNVLLVGIDTRETGQVELNTDTIILASYDSKTNRLSMLSFPRDLAVTYPNSSYTGRINAVYASAENKKKDSGLASLQSVVEQLSGKKIQYSAMVDLKGFIDAIDVLGGVDIYLDYDLSGLYPVENFQYERVTLKKGWNHFSGSQALKYSRMRKEMVPSSEEGDFARSKRQQKVIQAVLDKATKTETILNAKKVWDLLSVASKNIKTSKFGLDEIQAGITILKDKGKPTTSSLVLDLYAGGSAYRLIDVINDNPYLLGPKAGAGNWGEIQGFINEYFLEPTLVTMNKKIAVYHNNDAAYSEMLSKMTKRHYYTVIYDAGTLPTPTNGTVHPAKKVIAVGGKSFDNAAKYLAVEYGLELSTDKDILPTYLPDDIAIVVIL